VDAAETNIFTKGRSSHKREERPFYCKDYCKSLILAV